MVYVYEIFNKVFLSQYKFRGLQSDNVQRVRDARTLGPKMGCLHQIPPLKAQGTLQKRRQKGYKSQRGWMTPGEQGN